MSHLLAFVCGGGLGVILGMDHVWTHRSGPSPRQVVRDTELAAEEIERIQREAVERMRKL